MNRRSFLRALLASTAIAAVPPASPQLFGGAGTAFRFKAALTNTGPVTMAFGGGRGSGKRELRRLDGTPLRAGDLKAGETIFIEDGASHGFAILHPDQMRSLLSA